MSTDIPASTSASRGKQNPIARYAPTVARFLLGLPLIVFGLNLFLNFIPPPSGPMPEKAMAFAGALVATGYMMPLIGVTQLTVGVLLVINRFVPLALVMFFPFMLNSVAFHVALERSGLPMACVFMALNLYLAWVYRSAYRPILTARTPLN
jgi:putative oxidoreductase